MQEIGKDKSLKKILTLFMTAFSVSMTANSGYAIVSVLKERFVNSYKLISEEEMNDLIALAQSAPGPMGINASLVTGYRCAGIPGAVAAVLGCTLPPFLIMIPVTVFYQSITGSDMVRAFMKGMQAGVIAMLADIIISMWKGTAKGRDPYPYIVIIMSFLYIRFSGLPFYWLLLLCLSSAVIRAFLIIRKAGVKDAA